MNKIVLGIDAAWTARNPSGVALIADRRLLRAAPSYRHFLEPGWPGRPVGGELDAPALIGACAALAGAAPDLVAVDMPLSRHPIHGRRVSDNAVSSAYGGRGAGTHSPLPDRPGPLAERLRDAFAAQGYALWTDEAAPGQGLIEVYPHPALIELTGAPRRLQYKYGKTRAYWPGHDLTGRQAKLRTVWADIVTHLEAEIAGVGAALHGRLSGKAFEDMLDAIICAWIGVCVLESRAKSYGDAVSAIWIPTAR